MLWDTVLLLGNSLRLFFTLFRLAFLLCYLRLEQSLRLIFSSTDITSFWVLYLIFYKIWSEIPLWLMGIQTISSRMWIPRMVTCNPFRLFFLWLCVVSSHTCTDQYSAQASSEILTTSPEPFFFFFWSFCCSLVSGSLPCKLYPLWRTWIPNSISSTQGDSTGLCLGNPFWYCIPILSPGSYLWQSQSSPCLLLFFQGLLITTPQCLVSGNIVSYILKFFY